MLEIVKYGEDEYDFPCLLVLGCFDGLHIGHMDLLKKAKLQAKINGLDLGVMMFVDGKGGKQLYSFEERISILEKYNVKFVLKIDFDDKFKSIKPLDFLACLEDKLNVKAYMSGKDFRFGNGKKGKSSTLKSYADDEENGVWYMPVKDVVYNGEKVSTTSIKSLLAQGNVKYASELLGRPYSVTGKIVHGADRGGKVLGLPTINVVYPDYKFEIQQGVYQVSCIIEDKTYTGVANYGARPTFDESEVLLEVNLNDCDEDLYDKIATVEFIDYIRDIEKFDDPEKLSEQIQKDKQAQGEIAVAEVEETEAEPLITVSDLIGEEQVAETVEVTQSEEIPEQANDQEVAEPVEEVVETEDTQTEEVPEQANDQEVAEPVEEVVETEDTQNEEVPEQTNDQEVAEPAEEAPLNSLENPVEEPTIEEEIEQANEEFYEELDEELEISDDEIKEIEAHDRRRIKNIIEEIKLEGDKSEETKEAHSEIIEEKDESEEENND